MPYSYFSNMKISVILIYACHLLVLTKLTIFTYHYAISILMDQIVQC